MPLLDGNECNDKLYYMIDLSDGDGAIFDKFHMSASNGNYRNMTLNGVLDYFGGFVGSDIVTKIYVDCY